MGRISRGRGKTCNSFENRGFFGDGGVLRSSGFEERRTLYLASIRGGLLWKDLVGQVCVARTWLRVDLRDSSGRQA